MALTTPITPTLPDDEIRGLEDQITELAAHIHAANYRLLTMIGRVRCADGGGRFSGNVHSGLAR